MTFNSVLYALHESADRMTSNIDTLHAVFQRQPKPPRSLTVLLWVHCNLSKYANPVQM